MANATVIEVTTFVCSECSEEIDRCDGCDKIFEADDGIACTDEGHMCTSCVGGWRGEYDE